MTNFGALQNRNALAALGLLAALLTTGCRLTKPGGVFGARGPSAPIVIEPSASTPQIVAAVNQNTSRVHSYLAPNASFTTPGLAGVPLLRGSLMLERPRRFRLRAGTALSGDEIDLGSNDELFWLWAKRNEPPAVYFARHDQHGSGAARQLLPIDPNWVADALGLVTLDPNASYEGPFPRADGSLELRHVAAGPSGPMQRVTVVDPTRAWVIEQHVYDQAGTLVASSTASDFQFDPLQQVSLPHKVTIRIPNADLSFAINTGSITLNTPIANPSQQWSLPSMESYPQVDLGRSDGLPMANRGSSAPAPASVPAANYMAPTTIYTQPPSTYRPPPVTPAPASSAMPPQAGGYPAATVRTVQRLPAGGIELPPVQ